MDLTFEQLLQLVTAGAVVHLTVNLSGGGGTTPPPAQGRVEYVVDTSVDEGKHNNRVKVFPSAGKGTSEVGYVFDGDHVFGPGNTVNIFTEIDVPLEGFVESKYLKRV